MIPMLLKIEPVKISYHQLIIISCLVMVLFFPTSVFALDVEEVIWGFGNQRTKEKCIPLSLRLSNNTPDPFDEVVQLNRLQAGSKTGAPLYRKIYIAPYSSKWVQYYPYIIDLGQNDWSLNWGPRFLYNLKIPDYSRWGDASQSALGQKIRVVLTSGDSLSRDRSRFRQFPEALFPPFVTATDSLDEVFLNHLPQWESVRRKSFMDWLYRGGVLHLFPDLTGTNLEFSASMAELNVPLDHFRVGEGLVIRHQGKMNKLNQDKIESILNQIEIDGLSAINVTAPTAKDRTSDEDQYENYHYYGDMNSNFLGQLTDITRPEHNWELIYLMTFLYIFTIFPGCYFFQKKQKGYRNSLLFLLITVGLFSTIFWTIGKRGYGETTTINSLVIARPLKGNYYDLTCWNDSFVTDGAEYEFSAEGEGVIYTTAQAYEKVRGAIYNGVDGKFFTDIPPFSDRRFMYRIKAPYTKTGFQVLDYQITKDSALSSLKIGLKSNLPENISKMQVFYNHNLYDLKVKQEQGRKLLELDRGRTALIKWKKTFEDEMFYGNPYGYRYRNGDQDASEIYEGLYEPLVMHCMNIRSEDQLGNYQGKLSQIQLYIYCDLPEEFKLRTDVQGLQQGRVLFVTKLALPEKKVELKNE